MRCACAHKWFYNLGTTEAGDGLLPTSVQYITKGQNHEQQASESLQTLTCWAAHRVHWALFSATIVGL